MLLPLITTILLAGIFALRLPTDLSGVELPLAFCLALAIAARIFPRFAIRLQAVSVLTAFGIAILMLIYGLGTLERPWIDHHLAAVDASFGLSAGSVVEWTVAHPLIERTLFIVYCSVIPQTLLAIAVLHEGVRTFATRFMVGALLTAAAFAFAPAGGSCVHFGIPTPDHYVGILGDLSDLRAGSWILSWCDMQGIVTFPSFHAMWAVFLIAAFRGRWAWIMTPLNLLVVVSTVTTGMHYFTDSIVGIAAATLVIVATRWRIEPFSWARPWLRSLFAPQRRWNETGELCGAGEA